MTRRLPDPPGRHAPLAPPKAPGSPGERPPVDPEDPTESDEPNGWDGLEADLESDLEGDAAWEAPDDDDDDDGTWPADEPGDLEDLPTLDAPIDDQEEEDRDLPTDERPLDDDLDDLTAVDEEQLPVVSFAPVVRVDGQMMPGRAEPTTARTVWRGAPFTGARRVVLEVASVRWTAEVIGAAGEPAEVVLGCDALSGRFLLRP